jgi:hypothetical protein
MKAIPWNACKEFERQVWRADYLLQVTTRRQCLTSPHKPILPYSRNKLCSATTMSRSKIYRLILVLIGQRQHFLPVHLHRVPYTIFLTGLLNYASRMQSWKLQSSGFKKSCMLDQRACAFHCRITHLPCCVQCWFDHCITIARPLQPLQCNRQTINMCLCSSTSHYPASIIMASPSSPTRTQSPFTPIEEEETYARRDRATTWFEQQLQEKTTVQYIFFKGLVFSYCSQYWVPMKFALHTLSSIRDPDIIQLINAQKGACVYMSLCLIFTTVPYPSY